MLTITCGHWVAAGYARHSVGGRCQHESNSTLCSFHWRWFSVWALPDDVRGYLLPQPGWIQSDDPLIVAKAQELVDGAIRQVEAVDAIAAWVRGNIAYDYTFSLPADASSVFRNRSGVCAGFSTLTVALLRAAGIPARYHSGCVASAFPNN